MKSSARRAALHDAAGIHDHDPVGDLGDHAHIMGDEHDGGAEIARSLRIRSRIWACTVTSSAVVGSSAISSEGLQDSAMAMTARWRMPPES